MREDSTFSHHKQGRVDFNTVNTDFPRGMDFMMYCMPHDFGTSAYMKMWISCKKSLLLQLIQAFGDHDFMIHPYKLREDYPDQNQ